MLSRCIGGLQFVWPAYYHSSIAHVARPFVSNLNNSKLSIIQLQINKQTNKARPRNREFGMHSARTLLAYGFCRAMLPSSAAFAVMQCLCVCVCLYVTFVNHVKTNKHIFKIFSPSGSPIIPVFPYQTAWQYSDGNPTNEGLECRRGRLKSRFSTTMGLRSIPAAPWFVFGTLRPAFCLLWVLDDQARHAVHSHGDCP